MRKNLGLDLYQLMYFYINIYVYICILLGLSTVHTTLSDVSTEKSRNSFCKSHNAFPCCSGWMYEYDFMYPFTYKCLHKYKNRALYLSFHDSHLSFLYGLSV